MEVRTYKGFRVETEVSPGLGGQALVIVAPAGCEGCRERVTPGHFACSITPGALRDDPHVERVFVDGEWKLVFVDSPPDDFKFLRGMGRGGLPRL